MGYIVVTLKSGKVVDFPDTGRPGGSYGNSVRYEGEFAIIKDAWDKETAFPAADVDHIENTPRRGW